MSKMRQFVLTASLLAFTVLSTSGTVGAAGFDQFIVFGDSTLDTGYFVYHKSGNGQFDAALATALQEGATGGWAGNGVMNTTILADKFNLPLLPVDAPGGGTNYANGGATTVYNYKSMVPDNVWTNLQIERYLNSVGGAANPNALYLIKTGDNDVTFFNSQPQKWQEDNRYYLRNVAAEMSEEVARLQAAGARTIVVRNSYDSALFAGPGGDIPVSNQENYRVSKAMGTAEWTDLTSHGVQFIPADNDSLFRFIAHNPTLFGFNVDTVQANNAIYANPHVSAIFDLLSPALQQQYLFLDGVHLTTAGQTIEADYTYSLLTAPSEISLIAENAVQGGWTRAATIQGQIEASTLHRECGRHFWTNAGAYNTKVTNATGFTNDSGSPFGGAMGLDYQLQSGLLLGAAITASGQSQRFSTGGHFDQADEAPSLYAAYLNGQFWANAVLTYDQFQDNVVRFVPLGIFTDENHGYTTGQSLALALRGGRDFTLGSITTGPVLGLVMQQAYVNDFTENGATGVTALSFGSQTRNSLVSQFGWRVLADWGSLQPFAEANWNHEWGDRNRSIMTTLTSVAAPSYFMDAAPVGSDWAALSLGSYYKLSSRAILRGSLFSMFGNPQMESYGGELGLNVCF